ncbi:glycosyltransferase family 2 protein [Selenomonas ruminantium]|uniref:glycosyltransferase family 2 protein n=1 Tax=Selenomonas ruminantium TaxID=971 RepID=UPI00041E281C|nr:glycosyltransferase family 2 protein [Selenomonas ruminantium]
MSDKQPLVSILIPVYNREALLRPCIESALAQTYENTEIIVVDNQSTDGTWDLCKEYAAKYPKVKVYRNEKNLGPVGNWLSCMNHANGELGKILFSDDLMYETYLEKTVPCLKEKVGLVFSSVEIGTEPGRGMVNYRYKEETNLYKSECFIKELLLGNFGLVSPGAALFRLRDMKINLCYGTEIIPSPSIHDFDKHGAGPDLWLYLSIAGKYPQIAYFDEPLCFFRVHDGSITMTDSKTRYLDKCYFQTRIAYCESCFDKIRGQMLAEWMLKNEWRKYLRESHRWMGFYEFASQYTLDIHRYNISYFYVKGRRISYLYRRIKEYMFADKRK